MRAKKIVEDILELDEAIGYRALWMSPTGEFSESSTHIRGAQEIFSKDAFLSKKLVRVSYEDQVELMYDTLYELGWVRIAVEKDRISVSPLLSNMPLVQKNRLRKLSSAMGVSAYDDNGTRLRESVEQRSR